MRSNRPTDGSRFSVVSHAEADHSQPRVEGPLAERCAEHVEDSKQVAEPRGSFGVIGPGTKLRVRESRCCHRGSEVEVDCLQRALANTREAARERPLEVHIKECREFLRRAEHRVAKLEADLVAETTRWRKAEHD